MIPQRIVYSSLFYTLSMILVVVSKPTGMFDEIGNPRGFGIGNEKTLFSLGVTTVVLAVISFYVFTLIDCIFSGTKL